MAVPVTALNQCYPARDVFATKSRTCSHVMYALLAWLLFSDIPSGHVRVWRVWRAHIVRRGRPLGRCRPPSGQEPASGPGWATAWRAAGAGCAAALGAAAAREAAARCRPG